MSEPDFLSPARIAILGLGLMGGSLALALKGHCRSILAFDPDPETVSLARQVKVVDRVSSHLEEIVPQANLVILAAPINAILTLIEKLPNLHPGGAMVLDLGSTKRQIVQKMETLPPRFDPIGGHPMCGKETGGLQHAEASIFKTATFAFTSLARTSGRARSTAEQLASAVGSRTMWLDPDTHDRWTAATSHLPYLTAAALALTIPFEAWPLVGPGFKSSTRVAATPTSIMLDVLSTNQDNILEGLDQFRQQLDALREKLSRNEFDDLEVDLDQSASRRSELINYQS
jgi:prephenate dehydrogenase